MSNFGVNSMNKSSYVTWYEFKKDLQNEAKYSILNREWLQIKPRDPLPWDDSFMNTALQMMVIDYLFEEGNFAKPK